MALRGTTTKRRLERGPSSTSERGLIDAPAARTAFERRLSRSRSQSGARPPAWATVLFCATRMVIPFQAWLEASFHCTACPIDRRCRRHGQVSNIIVDHPHTCTPEMWPQHDLQRGGPFPVAVLPVGEDSAHGQSEPQKHICLSKSTSCGERFAQAGGLDCSSIGRGRRQCEYSRKTLIGEHRSGPVIPG